MINGSKSFITNAGTDITAWSRSTAVTGTRPDGRKEISSILVPVGHARGSRVAKKYSKVGWHASDTRELSFDDCRVPEANLLGERGRGYAKFLAILDEGRIAIAALAVGLAQGCVDESRALRQGAGGLRPAPSGATRRIAVQDRRHGDPGPHRAPRLLRARRRRCCAGEPFKKEAAIAKLIASERGDGQRPRRDPDLRRLRVHERVRRRPALAGREDPRDRRGHLARCSGCSSPASWGCRVRLRG